MLVWNGIQEKVIDFSVHYRRTYVIPLERLPVIFRGIIIRLMRHLDDKHFACLGKENRGLCGDHADVLIGLHDLLDPCKRQFLVLEPFQIIYAN